jgi:hypothetical protein
MIADPSNLLWPQQASDQTSPSKAGFPVSTDDTKRLHQEIFQ